MKDQLPHLLSALGVGLWSQDQQGSAEPIALGNSSVTPLDLTKHPLNTTHRHHQYRVHIPFLVASNQDCSAPVHRSCIHLDSALPHTSHGPSFEMGLWCWIGSMIRHLLFLLSILGALNILCLSHTLASFKKVLFLLLPSAPTASSPTGGQAGTRLCQDRTATA